MNNLDLIKQYVNTGQPIGDYQVSKLSGNLLKSYLRKRSQLSSHYELTGYEFSFMTPEQQWDYFLQVIKDNGVISRDNFDVIPDYMKNNLLNYFAETKEILKPANDFIFEAADTESKIKYIEMSLEQHRIKSNFLPYMSKDLMFKFVTNESKDRIKHNQWINLNSHIYSKIPDDLKSIIIDTYIKMGMKKIPDWIFDITPKNLQKHFVKSVANSGYSILIDFYNDLSDDVQFEYLKELFKLLKTTHSDTWHLYISNQFKNDYERLKLKFEK